LIRKWSRSCLPAPGIIFSLIALQFLEDNWRHQFSDRGRRIPRWSDPSVKRR
jgi:hypothetical protein